MYWKKIIWIAAGIGLTALVIFKLSGNKKVTENKVYQYDKEKPISVQVDTIHLKTINEASSYTGTFEPNKETKISAETQGKINIVLVDVGSYVSKGQTIIQLDNSLLRLQLQSVEVQIEGLQDDVNRYKILAQAGAVEGIQLEKAQLGLKSAKVQKASLQEQIAKTRIKAPFNGVVTAKLNEVGGFAAPGVPLLQITDIAILKFTINVPETDLRQFQPNKQYLISADTYSDNFLPGKVTMIGSKANPGNSFPIQFQVANTKKLDIKSGMFGKVQINEISKEQGIIVPSSAIFGSNEKTQVYLIKHGKAVLQDITVSKKMQDKSVVSGGLNAGDVIVTNGFINLFDEANVVINKISEK